MSERDGWGNKHSERRMEGYMEGSSGEEWKRHVIICRSSTSPVNPRSRLTWLIKEAIKGPPPEILRKDERERETRESEEEGHRPEIERRPNGENERWKERGGYGKEDCDDLYCFIRQPSLLDSWMRLSNTICLLFFLCLHQAITL